MDQSDMLSLMQDLTYSEADITTPNGIEYLQNVLTEASKNIKTTPRVSKVTWATISGTSSYSLDTLVTGISMPLIISLEDKDLFPTDTSFLESLDKDWRAETGQPFMYAIDEEDNYSIKVYPEPDAIYNGVIVFTSDYTDLPDYLSYPFVFESLSREYERQSDHTDIKYSQLLSDMSDMFKKIVRLA